MTLKLIFRSTKAKSMLAVLLVVAACSRWAPPHYDQLVILFSENRPEIELLVDKYDEHGFAGISTGAGGNYVSASFDENERQVLLRNELGKEMLQLMNNAGVMSVYSQNSSLYVVPFATNVMEDHVFRVVFTIDTDGAENLPDCGDISEMEGLSGCARRLDDDWTLLYRWEKLGAQPRSK